MGLPGSDEDDDDDEHDERQVNVKDSLGNVYESRYLEEMLQNSIKWFTCKTKNQQWEKKGTIVAKNIKKGAMRIGLDQEKDSTEKFKRVGDYSVSNGFWFLRCPLGTESVTLWVNRPVLLYVLSTSKAAVLDGKTHTDGDEDQTTTWLSKASTINENGLSLTNLNSGIESTTGTYNKIRF